MAHVERDMYGAWTDLEDYFEHCAKAAAEAITDVYDTALDTLTSGAHTRSGNETNTAPSFTTLIRLLRHRRNLTIADTDDAIHLFRDDLSNLQTNALSPLRTAFIGELMEAAYRAANLESGSFPPANSLHVTTNMNRKGRGSDSRRKTLIRDAFGSKLLFKQYRRACKTGFESIVSALQDDVDAAVLQQFRLMEADLQVLRDDHAILEAEQDPAFRERVVAQLASARKEMENCLNLAVFGDKDENGRSARDDA